MTFIVFWFLGLIFWCASIFSLLEFLLTFLILVCMHFCLLLLFLCFLSELKCIWYCFVLWVRKRSLDFVLAVLGAVWCVVWCWDISHFDCLFLESCSASVWTFAGQNALLWNPIKFWWFNILWSALHSCLSFCGLEERYCNSGSVFLLMVLLVYTPITSQT